MIPRKTAPLPTDAELQILNVLWERGPSTVRDVHESLGADTGYTTALKLLQIMHEKGLVTRDESRRAHIYTMAEPREETQQRIARDLVDRAFGGSAATLVLRALSAKRTSAAERARIRARLEELDERDES